jgi:hypothetical protein
MPTTQQLGASGGGAASGQADVAVTTIWPPGPGWMHLLTKQITVEHIGASTPDAYGNATDTITSVDIVFGYLEPMSEAVHLVESDTLVTTHQVVLPPQIELTADDTIVVDGVSYRVIEALHVTNARTGIDHHIEGRVVQVSG